MVRPDRLLLVIAMLAIGARPAVAAPLTYTMTLTPDSITCPSLPFDAPCAPPFPAPTLGQPYVGFFTLADDAVLAVDGINIPAELTAFRLVLGGFVWDASQHFPASEFSGFRGPKAGDPFCPGGAGTQTPVFAPGGSAAVCLDARNPGFNVSGGQLIGLWGGVFGSGDVPFVDFQLFAGSPNRFNSNLGIPNTVRGSIVLAQVPTAPTLLLLSVGLGIANLISKRLRRRGRHG